MKHALSIIALTVALPAIADETRQLDAHEHGVGTLNIAIEGETVAMTFEAPGADIVGFEYAAESETDLAAIDAAITTLGAPFDLFVTPEAAGCTVTSAEAELESEDGHDGEESHTEFHAEYALICENLDALTEITFPYFDAFPNAEEVEVQIVTASGAQAFEVERDAPVLTLGR